MIIKQTRINKLSCLDWAQRGEKIVIALSDAIRFKENLIGLGFSAELGEGERILPAIVNSATRKNAEPFYSVDKLRPKETYYQTLLWKRQEWAGRGKTREVTDYVSIPRTRYARIWHAPYSVEFTLKNDEKRGLMVVTEPLEFCKENDPSLINTINMFLMTFGECEILTNNLENLSPEKVIKLNWEVLPKGIYPWEKVKTDIETISRNSSGTSRKILLEKCEYINSFHPNFIAYGKSGFRGYMIFGFIERNLYVLESVYMNNATYIFGSDWEYLSKLSKAEILNSNLQIARLIHKENWRQEISKMLS